MLNPKHTHITRLRSKLIGECRAKCWLWCVESDGGVLPATTDVKVSLGTKITRIVLSNFSNDLNHCRI